MYKLDILLSEKETAEFTGLSQQALSQRRRKALESGRQPILPYLIHNGRVRYRKADLEQFVAEGRPCLKPRKGKPKAAANCLSQRQAMVLLGIPKGMLDYDYRNGRNIPVVGWSSTPFYPLDGIKAYLAKQPDRLLPVDWAATALNTTREKLDEDRRQARENGRPPKVAFVAVADNRIRYAVSTLLAVLTEQMEGQQ